MKHWKKKAVAMGLALTMMLTPFASASQAMGWEVQGSSTQLSVGTSLTKQIFWSDTYSDLRVERYFTYTPNPSVTPTVVYGNKVLTKAALTSMAQTLEGQGHRVVGGINGDLYVVATGAPLGVVVTEGVARSVPGSDNAWYYAVGGREDGTAFIGQPRITSVVSFQGASYLLRGGVNKIRNAKDDFVLLTEDFAATTQNNEAGVDVILTPVLDQVGESVALDLNVQGSSDPANLSKLYANLLQSAQPTLGGRVTYQVEQVLSSTGAIPIPEGKAILSINEKSSSNLVEAARRLQPGDRVDLDITSEESAWREADQAMGGLYRLVAGGQVSPGLGTERTAYSAVGVKADGTAVFYTVDGKQPGYSVGATLTQVAMRMVELGCVDAISLDGGGSTTIGAAYPDGSLNLINKPSDGSQRANSVAVFLTTDLKPSGEQTGLYVTPNEGFLLSGAKLPLNAAGLDSHYYTMPLTAAPDWAVRSGDGAVSPEGVFTAGKSAGVAQVEAAQGGFTGSTAITVVNRPDQLKVLEGATKKELTLLALDPGATVDLTASAIYRGLLLGSQDDCFTWSVDSAVGTVDSQGVCTAGRKTASGNLTVSAGGLTVTLPVSVAGQIKTLESFEGGIGSVSAAGGLALSQERGLDHVRYGSASLRVGYDATQGGGASLTTALSFSPGTRYLGFWVYGDNSQNSLTATVADGQGVTSEVMLTGLDFQGWRYIAVTLPEGAAGLRSINLLYGDMEKTTGTFWLDQLTTSNEPLRDETPPVVSVNLSGGQLTAVISDLLDKKFTDGQIRVTYDGSPLSFIQDGAGAVRATLPASDGKLHRVAVMATDASGNIGRGAANVGATSGRAPVFTDTPGHWAEAFATYLYDHKVSQGVPGGQEGELLFQPDKAITRGELFVLAARWLRLDLSQYAGVQLPFADVADIPAWALPGVRAMYAQGYLKGSAAGDGKLYANTGANISRAEAMTLLGRVQPRGYAQADLAVFADAAQVPNWAVPYVKTLVGQGVVSGGADGLIHPGDPIKRGEAAKIFFGMT